jgi:hypothetical protein
MRNAVICGAVAVSAGMLHPATAGAQTAAQPDSAVIEVNVDAPRDGVTKTSAGPVRGWQALTSASATKIETPLLNLPQAVTVLPRQAIEAQGAVNRRPPPSDRSIRPSAASTASASSTACRTTTTTAIATAWPMSSASRS